MADPAMKPMTLDEFLRWDDGTDTHYELIGGIPIAMPLLLEAQRILITRLATRLEAALAGRRAAQTLTSFGVIPQHLTDTFLVADIAVGRTGIDPWSQDIEAPFLVVEVSAPNTERRDRRTKLPAYRQIDSVQEVALVAADGVYAEVHRRAGAHWVSDIYALRGGKPTLELASVPIEVPFVDLYEGVAARETKGD